MGLKNSQGFGQGPSLYGPPVGIAANNNSGLMNSSGIDQSAQLDPKVEE